MVDIRCVGLTGAIDLAPIPGSPTLRGYKVLDHSFHEAGIMLRISGDTIELTPPLIVSEDSDRRDHGEDGGVDQSGGVNARAARTSRSAEPHRQFDVLGERRRQVAVGRASARGRGIRG